MQNHTSRRAFLRDGFLVAGGAAAGMLLPRAAREFDVPAASGAPQTGGAERRLREPGTGGLPRGCDVFRGS